MRGFKTNYNGTKIKVRKNRNSSEDNIFYTYFLKCRKAPDFMSEDTEFNVDAELEADFISATA